MTGWLAREVWFLHAIPVYSGLRTPPVLIYGEERCIGVKRKVLWFGIKLLDWVCLSIDSGFVLIMIGHCSGMCDGLVCGRIVFLFVWRPQ